MNESSSNCGSSNLHLFFTNKSRKAEMLVVYKRVLLELDSATWVQILDEADSVSFRTCVFGKNPSVLLPRGK